MSYKVLVCGSRDYTNKSKVYQHLNYIAEENEFYEMMIICGGAKGADTFAYNWSLDNGFFFVIHNADWDQHGRAAGPIRNQQMLDTHPDLQAVIAFYETLGPGTRDMCTRAVKNKIPVYTLDTL